ncbi:MAG: cupin domain-containing protein [Pseudomonadota bacterium]
MRTPTELQALMVENLFEPEQLLATREWSELRPGVNISPIYNTTQDGPSAAFLHYLPGAAVPRHLHTDFEHILILQGSQSDGQVTYGRGTLLVSTPQSEHQIHSAEGCIALAVWVKPVAFVEITQGT